MSDAASGCNTPDNPSEIMTPDRLPTISQLTPDDRVWRIDWFGDIAYPGSVRRYAQPSVKVVLSAIRCDSSNADALISPDGSDYQRQHETWAPIASMPMLTIGDLWQMGQHKESPDLSVPGEFCAGVPAEIWSGAKAGFRIAS